MIDPRPSSKVSLEDLLHLKRAERPSPEFWTKFEAELHQKQLTALVEKRRWWHELPVLINRRVYVPAGAAAVVAFTLVAVRYNAPMRVAEAGNTAPRIEAADVTVEMLPATVVAASTAKRYAEPIADTSSEAESVASRTEKTDRAVAPVMVSMRDEISPSARSIAANLARLEQAEPELINAVMGSRLSSSARVQHAMAQAEVMPAASSEPASRYRLIARYAERALRPEPAAPVLVREHIARRLGDDLGDDMSRFGVGGDRVSLKF